MLLIFEVKVGGVLTETQYILYVAMAIGFKLQYEVNHENSPIIISNFTLLRPPGAGVPVKVKAFSATPHAPPSPIGG